MYKVNQDQHKPINPSGFRWMPAACSFSDHAGLSAYVRYKRYRDEPIRVHHKETNRIVFTCPDRDLMILRDGHHQWPYKPPEGVWDEFVNFGTFQPNSMTDNDLQFQMVNYTDHLGSSTNSSLTRLTRERLPHEGLIVADSGGFQLGMGRYDWIDPLELIRWYNQNVDLGMVLDIPTAGVTNKDDINLMALAQAHNNRTMLNNKRPSLELINIFHGNDLESINKYRSIVETPEIDRLALGGTYAGTLMATIDSNFGLMTALKDDYKHFHILGVWNLLQLIPFMRFASHNIVKLITSDSSTPIQNANAKRYAYQPAIDDTWRMRDLGLISPTTQSSHHLTLPCCCCVCSTVKYTDVLATLGGAALTHILAYHNVFQMNNYIKTMYPLIQKLSIKEITELMLAQVGNRRGVQEARWGLQLADEIAAHGYPAARKKFSSYIYSKDVKYDTDTSNLFEIPDHKETEQKGVEATSEGVKRKIDLAKRFLSTEVKDKGVHGRKTEVVPKKIVMSAKASARKLLILTAKVKDKENPKHKTYKKDKHA